MHIVLVDRDGNSLFDDRELLDRYYDHMVAVERQFRPEAPDEDLHFESTRRSHLRRIQEEDVEGVSLGEPISSDMGLAMDLSGIDVNINHFDRDSIEEIRKVLEDARDEMQQRNDDTPWDLTFATRIAVCDFALEHDDLGIKLSV